MVNSPYTYLIGRLVQLYMSFWAQKFINSKKKNMRQKSLKYTRVPYCTIIHEKFWIVNAFLLVCMHKYCRRRRRVGQVFTTSRTCVREKRTTAFHIFARLDRGWAGGKVGGKVGGRSRGVERGFRCGGERESFAVLARAKPRRTNSLFTASAQITRTCPDRFYCGPQ